MLTTASNIKIEDDDDDNYNGDDDEASGDWYANELHERESPTLTLFRKANSAQQYQANQEELVAKTSKINFWIVQVSQLHREAINFVRLCYASAVDILELPLDPPWLDGLSALVGTWQELIESLNPSLSPEEATDLFDQINARGIIDTAMELNKILTPFARMAFNVKMAGRKFSKRADNVHIHQRISDFQNMSDDEVVQRRNEQQLLMNAFDNLLLVLHADVKTIQTIGPKVVECFFETHVCMIKPENASVLNKKPDERHAEVKKAVAEALKENKAVMCERDAFAEAWTEIRAKAMFEFHNKALMCANSVMEALDDFKRDFPPRD